MNEREPNTVQGIATRYNQLRPQTISESMSTGPEETAAIGELWHTELGHTIRAFKLTRWTIEHLMNIRVSMILQHDMQGNTIRDDGRPGPKVSDNRLTRLVYEDDAQTLLSMQETRNDNNAQVIQIARYPLLRGTIMSLEQAIEADNFYRRDHPNAEEW